MSFLVLNLLLLVLTATAIFTLYQVIGGRDVALTDRFNKRVSPSRARVSERVSALMHRSARRTYERRSRDRADLQLYSTLSYAGFRGVDAAAIFQLARSALMIGTAAAGFALSTAADKSSLGGVAVGCLLGYVLPTFIIRRIARARQRRITSELPDVLALLVVSIEGGIGFGEVIKLVGREVERQGRLLGRELSITAAHMAAGRSFEDSLNDLGQRNGVDVLKSLVALIIQSEKVGARIAPALRASADLLNSRRRQVAEEAANKTAVKMLIPLVFLILPAMMLIVLGPAIIQIVRMLSHTT